MHLPFAMNIFMDSRERPISMSLRPATELFSEWADAGRDEGMERGHTPSVEVMLNRLLEGRKEPFSAIDIEIGRAHV